MKKSGWGLGAFLFALGLMYLMTRSRDYTPEELQRMLHHLRSKDSESSGPPAKLLSPSQGSGLNSKLQKGRDAIRSQDFDVAIAAFDDVIHLDSKSAEAYYWRGIAYGKKGDQIQAHLDRDKAIDLNETYKSSPPDLDP